MQFNYLHACFYYYNLFLYLYIILILNCLSVKIDLTYFVVIRSHRIRGPNPLKDAESSIKMGKDKDIITGRYKNPVKGKFLFFPINLSLSLN